MEIGAHLPDSDACRIRRVFAKLERLGLTDFAVTGGMALEAALAGRGVARTALNDIDLAAPGFASLPARLGDGFLVRHVHRDRPPGKLMLQLVCPDDALRVDVFGARGGLLARAGTGRIGPRAVRVAALEDMASRIVSELVGLTRGEEVPAKAARDYARFAGALDPSAAETAWTEQRRGTDPDTFAEACRVVDGALARPGHRLDGSARLGSRSACPHCGDTRPFVLADPARMRALIGYD